MIELFIILFIIENQNMKKIPLSYSLVCHYTSYNSNCNKKIIFNISIIDLEHNKCI